MTRNPVSPAVREIVLARADGGLCEICWWQRAEQIHHRRPRAAGGSKREDANRPPNLLAVCSVDHLAIESNRELAYRRGWLVRQGHNPADVPVMRYGGAWALLDDAGNATPTTPPEGENGE